MEKERMSRREFLLWGFDAAGITALTFFLGPKLYPFLGLVSQPEKGSILPDDFVDVIETEERDVFLGYAGHKKVSLNKEIFAQALYDISSLYLPKIGPERLYALLRVKKLKVEFSPFDAEPEISGNQVTMVAGRYYRYLDGGPRIVFYPAFLIDYYRTQSLKSGAEVQKGVDGLVWHEIFHLAQDVRKPLASQSSANIVNLQDTGSKLELTEDPDIWSSPAEVEAFEGAARIIETKYQNYINDPKVSWPFGKFFTFS